MSVLKDKKFIISAICAYFNIFQLKPVVKSDNIPNFTEISIFSPFKVEICSSKFQIGDSFSHFSYHTQLAIVLGQDMSYLTPVALVVIVLSKSLGAIHMPECYTHATIISGICHFKWW